MKKKDMLLVRLLGIILGPILILSVLLTTFTVETLKSVMKERTQEALHNISVSLMSTYEAMGDGDYTQDANGNIYKGTKLISDDFQAVDYIKEKTEEDATFFFGDTRVLTTIKKEDGSRAVGTKASDEVIQEVLIQGKEYFDSNVLVNGVPYYGYYLPLMNHDNSIVGMVFAGTPSTEITAKINRTTNALIGIAVTVTVIFIFSTSALLWKITKNINRMMVFTNQMADGDLTAELDERVIKRRDEIGRMGAATIKLQKSFQSIVGQIKDTANSLTVSANNVNEVADQSSCTTDEVSRAIEDISNGAMSQADETQEASNSIQQIGEQIGNIAEDVESLNKTAEQMSLAEKEATNIFTELGKSNERTMNAVERIAVQTDVTNHSAQEIKKAVDLITSIATETNLLSLNASIEAARAGDAGRGFAVVATQIQKLAEQSNQSAKAIEDIIMGLLNESEKTVQYMNEVKENISEQNHNLKETKERFDDVRTGIQESMKGIHGIKDKTNDLNEARKNIVDALQNLSAISEENAASSEETTASTEELNAMIVNLANFAKELKELADKLDNDVDVFKI